LTTDFAVFLEIQEELLLRIMDIIEASGTAVALPSQTTYVVGESGLNPVRGRNAMQKIQNGREGNKSLFPGFPIEKISEFSDTSEYPPAGSAAQEKSEK
jgi:MscS family membrane protein